MNHKVRLGVKEFRKYPKELKSLCVGILAILVELMHIKFGIQRLVQ